MTTTSDLLGRGFLPKELPPPFGSETLGAAVASAKIPPTFGSTATRLCKHNVARLGGLRRVVGIPNPTTHFKLCQEVEAHWHEIEVQLDKSSISTSKPQIGSVKGRAVFSKPPDLAPLRAKCRSTARFVLKADISRFYYSIYTHSIPWAFHGKQYAKANKFTKDLGNQLDKYVRNTQDMQTMGIPVGPDTSLIIAEALLGTVDEILADRLPGLRALRYWDDYEFCFNSRVEAEKAMSVIQEVLSEYELALNPEKTEIFELPISIDTPWVAPLRQFRFRRKAASQSRDLVSYFDLATSLHSMYPRRGVFGYAIGRLRGIKLHRSSWGIFQDLLLQCLRAEPGVSPTVYELIRFYYELGWEINNEQFTEVLNNHIREHAPLGQASEVAWAIWMLIAYELDLDSSSSQVVGQMQDSVVALLALDARDKGLVPSGLPTSTWQDYMTTEELFGDQWLLSYEASIKGWMRSVGTKDHVRADPQFAALKKAGVSFYDSSRKLTTVSAPEY